MIEANLPHRTVQHVDRRKRANALPSSQRLSDRQFRNGAIHQRVWTFLIALGCLTVAACGGNGNSRSDSPVGFSAHRSNPPYALLRPGDDQDMEIQKYYLHNGEPSLEAVDRGFFLSARPTGQAVPVPALSLLLSGACAPSLNGICDRWTITNADGLNTPYMGYLKLPQSDSLATVAMFPTTPQLAPPVKHMAGGKGFSLALTTDGQVWSWGKNNSGQLGLGDTFDRSLPTRVAVLSNIVDIDAGPDYALALDAAGDVWAWGSNASGQLGDGTDDDKLSPVKVPGLRDVKDIAAAYQTAYALTRDGDVVGWGLTLWEWGPFSWPDSVFPVQVYEDISRHPVPVPTWESGRFLQGINSIYAGGKHQRGLSSDLMGDFAALADDGSLWLFGMHLKTLSDQNGNRLFIHTNIMAWDLDDGHLAEGETSETRPAITQVAIGDGFYLALDTGGRVWSAGYRSYTRHNQLGRDTDDPLVPGLIPGLDQVVQIAAGDNFGMALRADGQVWVWGYNGRGINGSVGFDDGVKSESGELLELPPLLVSPLHALSAHLDTVGQIAAGFGHALALESDESCDTGTTGPGGRIYSWGDGRRGLRGDGTGFQQLGATPVMTLGDDATCTGIIGDRLVIYKTGSGTGTVSSSVGGVDPLTGIDQTLLCRGAICWQRVPTGTTVTLTASAGLSATSSGTQWQWDCTSFPGITTSSVQVNGPTHCRINFEKGENATPVAAFTATPQPVVVGGNIVFDASASTGNLVRYQWDFNNDGTVNATGQSVNHRYPASGSYIARLVVTDAQGNSSEATQAVHVIEAAGNTALLTVIVVNDGTVRDANGGILCGAGNSDCSEEIAVGNAVQLTPMPGANNRNVLWDGCDQAFGLEGCFISNMGSDRTVTATFVATDPQLIQSPHYPEIQMSKHDKGTSRFISRRDLRRVFRTGIVWRMAGASAGCSRHASR